MKIAVAILFPIIFTYCMVRHEIYTGRNRIILAKEQELQRDDGVESEETVSQMVQTEAIRVMVAYHSRWSFIWLGWAACTLIAAFIFFLLVE